MDRETLQEVLDAMLLHPHAAEAIAELARTDPDGLRELIAGHGAETTEPEPAEVSESVREAVRAELARLLLEGGYTGSYIDAAGHKRTYVDGKLVPGSHDGGGSGSGQGGGHQPVGGQPSVPPATHEELNELQAALPEAGKSPGLWEKAKGLYGKARDVAFGVATDLALKASALAPQVLLVASDFERPHQLPGGSGDALAASLGISANDAALVASHALLAASRFVKKRLGIAEAEATPDFEALADLVLGVLRHTYDGMGAGDLPLPDRAEVLAKLRERLGGEAHGG